MVNLTEMYEDLENNWDSNAENIPMPLYTIVYNLCIELEKLKAKQEER